MRKTDKSLWSKIPEMNEQWILSLSLFFTAVSAHYSVTLKKEFYKVILLILLN